MPPDEDRATATGNMMHKYDIWLCGFRDWAEWTDRQTGRHAQHNTSHPFLGRILRHGR